MRSTSESIIFTKICKKTSTAFTSTFKFTSETYKKFYCILLENAENKSGKKYSQLKKKTVLSVIYLSSVIKQGEKTEKVIIIIFPKKLREIV